MANLSCGSVLLQVKGFQQQLQFAGAKEHSLHSASYGTELSIAWYAAQRLRLVHLPNCEFLFVSQNCSA